MSFQALNYVFEHSQSKGSDRLVLVALADQANDKWTCWPSQRTLAKRTNMSIRNVRRSVAVLVDLGELHLDRVGIGKKPTIYRLSHDSRADESDRSSELREDESDPSERTNLSSQSGQKCPLRADESVPLTISNPQGTTNQPDAAPNANSEEGFTVADSDGVGNDAKSGASVVALTGAAFYAAFADSATDAIYEDAVRNGVQVKFVRPYKAGIRRSFLEGGDRYEDAMVYVKERLANENDPVLLGTYFVHGRPERTFEPLGMFANDAERDAFYDSVRYCATHKGYASECGCPKQCVSLEQYPGYHSDLSSVAGLRAAGEDAMADELEDEMAARMSG